MCRRAHGAPLVTWAGVSAGQLRFLAGEELVREYQSSPGAFRGFCSVCGSTMFFRATRWAGEIHVAVANLDHGADQPPRAHVYFSDRADWFEVGDRLPRLGGATGVELIDEAGPGNR